MTITAVAVEETQPQAWFPSNASNREWAQMATAAPQLVANLI